MSEQPKKSIPTGSKLVELPYITHTFLQCNVKTPSCLIVGEREGAEGGVETVLQHTSDITCTDICPSGFIVKDLVDQGKIKFIQTDFVSFDESKKYDVIICISVLEHFGMIWSNNKMFNNMDTTEDTVLWNHDFKGIKKMCSLLKDENSIVGITVPCGPYINTEPHNGFPYQRNYNYDRINLVKSFVKSLNCKVCNEKFYYSNNFVEWFETDESISQPQYNHSHNAVSPNCVWAFSIKKS